MKQKEFLLLALILGSILLIIFYHTSFNEIRLFIIARNSSETKKFFSIQLNNVFRVCENAEWSTNRNIMQYSAYAIFKGDRIKIEVLMFFTYLTVKEYNKSFYCLIRNENNQNNDSKVFAIPITNKVLILPPVHKFTCDYHNVNASLGLDSKILVAIVYEPDFDFKLKMKDVGSKVDILPYEVIQYHRALNIDANKRKKEKIAHCVHMLYGIESIESKEMLRFTNWVHMQKSIGYDRIRLYVLNLTETVLEHLKEKYGGFLVFVQHPTTYPQLCGWLEDKRMREQDSIVMRNISEICEETFRKIYVPKVVTGPNDRMCMNDCYLNFKYEYELFTNYDIDEIILPRMHNMDDLGTFEAINCNSYSLHAHQPTYNIYDYGIKLLNQFGRGRIACLMFKHVAFLPNNADLDQFFTQLASNMQENKTGSINFVELHRKVPHSLTFNDYAHARKIIHLANLTGCLQERFSKINTTVASEFNRLIAVFFQGRWGKSISDTNLTETLNHHSCDSFTHGNKFDLDLKYGYASHFRNMMAEFFEGGPYPFNNINSDIEYFLFLLKLFS